MNTDLNTDTDLPTARVELEFNFYWIRAFPALALAAVKKFKADYAGMVFHIDEATPGYITLVAEPRK